MRARIDDLLRACIVWTAFAGCSSSQHGVTALYDTSPSRSDFFALPWPSDSRLITGSDGKKRLDLTGLYNPGKQIGQYLQTIGNEPVGGFGTSAGIFFRFDGPLDPASLPASPFDSVAANSPVYLIDVTPSSPQLGKRLPVRVHFSHDWGNYIGPDSLVLVPEPGFPLREQTTYAAVVTDGVRGADGAPVRSDARFTPPPPSVPLALPAGQSLVVATVFTTGEFTSIMKRLRDAVYAQAPEPQVADLANIAVPSGGLFDQYEGTYLAPNFQEGDPPYLTQGGRIHLGADGNPQVVRTEKLRFAMTVPHGQPMPPGGWPVVLYAHGTGGSFTTFVSDGSAAHAARISDSGGNVIGRMAMISIDQVLHGPRDPTGSSPDYTIYNFQNLDAAQSNLKQGALDDFHLLRLVKNVDIAAAPVTGVPIKFDPAHIYFEGHSQGSETGPLFLAFEPEVKAAILSGAGANLMLAFLTKTNPVNIKAVVEVVVDESVDEFHPLINLMQTYFESEDPANYGRYFFREPPSGLAAKSIFQGLGTSDSFDPPAVIKALALAMGVQPFKPTLDPIDDLPLRGLTWADLPLAGNVAGGAATAALGEYSVPFTSAGKPAYDGHFVVMNHPAAIFEANGFFATHVATGQAQVMVYTP
jgi:hypothetical protein